MMAQKSSGFTLKPVPQSAPSGRGIDLKRAVSVRVRVAKQYVEMLLWEMVKAKEIEDNKWSTNSSNHSKRIRWRGDEKR
jgi:hypothetical protein